MGGYLIQSGMGGGNERGGGIYLIHSGMGGGMKGGGGHNIYCISLSPPPQRKKVPHTLQMLNISADQEWCKPSSFSDLVLKSCSML